MELMSTNTPWIGEDVKPSDPVEIDAGVKDPAARKHKKRAVHRFH